MIRSAIGRTGQDARGFAGPRPLPPLALLAAFLTLAAGCNGGGTLAVRSSVQPLTLTGDFTTAVYRFDDPNNLDILLIEGPGDAPSQVVHIRMHWTPRAGRTPVDRRATNATIRYLVFTGDAVGMYSGAGFLFPRNKPGGESFRAELRNTTLRLDDRTDDFNDRLGLARVTGSFSARRDDAAALQLLRRVRVRLSERLGYPRLVEKGDGTLLAWGSRGTVDHDDE